MKKATLCLLFTALMSLVAYAQDTAGNINLNFLTKQIDSQAIPPVKAGLNLVFLVQNKILCEKIDCKVRSFKTSKYEVRIYTNEELFMRNIKNYVSVKEWNSSSKILFSLTY